jgi:hypothetical protein
MPTRPLRHLRSALAIGVLATASLASFACAATAGARPAPAEPTVVLVHGAFADSSGFAAVIERLRPDGYPVRAAPNRLADLQSDAAPSAVSSTASRGRRSSPVTPTAAP